MALVAIGCSEQPTEPPLAGPVQPPVAPAVIGCAGCIYLDHFTDQDGSLLENHVPDGEGIEFAWLKTIGPTAFRDTAVIRSNALGKERPGFWRYVTSSDVTDTTVVADTAEIDLEVLNQVPSGTQYDVGLVFRAPGPDGGGGFGGYTVFWSINGDGFGFFEVDRVDDNGSLLLLQDYPAIPSVGTHTLSGSVSNTGVIKIYVDGSLQASVTDPSPLPAGDLGLTFGFTGDPEVMRITSFVGRRRPESRIRIELVNGPLDVWPGDLGSSGGSGPKELQLRVRVDGGGVPLKNQVVKLSLSAVDSSGKGSDGPYSHFHDGVGGLNKPTGKLDPEESVDTGSDGLQGLVTYTSSIVSGPIVVRAEPEGALPDSFTIPVRVPGLAPLTGRNSYVLVGDRPWHPLNHWGLPIMVSKLEVLADAFSAKFGRPIYYNDMSCHLVAYSMWTKTGVPDPVVITSTGPAAT